MKRFAKLLTFWIPVRAWRHWLRDHIESALTSLIPLKENWVIFYDTFSKSGNGDSIRPLAIELRKRKPNMRFFFVAKEQKNIEMADEVLIIGSKRYEYVLRRAKYLFSPMDLPSTKRKGQIWVMTWHGNAIKSIYLLKDKSPEMYKQMSRFKPVDYWMIPSQKTKDIFKEMFNLPDNIFVDTGIPRNDILFADNKTKENIRKKVRQKYGLKKSDKIIFYCPTWRNDRYKMPFMIDIKLLKKIIGSKYKLLIRSHVGKHDWVDNDGNTFKFDDDFMIDVGEHAMISDLYLIADILICDYSSAILDFAILKKPIILFDYDYKDYIKKTGFCYDYKQEMPGPIVYTTKELAEAISSIDTIKKQYAKKYKSFIEKWNSFEQGNATQQILDLILNRKETK